MQLKGSGRKTLGRKGMKILGRGKGTISFLLKWKMRQGRVHKLPFSAKKLRVHSTTDPTKAKTQ
jgi:hypothetical protein